MTDVNRGGGDRDGPVGADDRGLRVGASTQDRESDDENDGAEGCGAHEWTAIYCSGSRPGVDELAREKQAIELETMTIREACFGRARAEELEVERDGDRAFLAFVSRDVEFS